MRSRTMRCFRKELGEVFIDYFLKLKRNEAGRFAQWLEQHGVQESGEPTQWEQKRVFRVLLGPLLD